MIPTCHLALPYSFLPVKNPSFHLQHLLFCAVFCFFFFSFFLMFILVYLAALGLSCGMWIPPLLFFKLILFRPLCRSLHCWELRSLTNHLDHLKSIFSQSFKFVNFFFHQFIYFLISKYLLSICFAKEAKPEALGETMISQK